MHHSPSIFPETTYWEIGPYAQLFEPAQRPPRLFSDSPFYIWFPHFHNVFCMWIY